jgi:MFS transporter, ACS family, D-galactonate transporter
MQSEEQALLRSPKRSLSAHDLQSRELAAKLPKIRFLMLLLVVLAVAIAYMDRVNIAISAPFIKKDLGISNAEMGLVLGAFFWSYAAMQIPAGRMIDRFGVRIGCGIAVLWWSIWTTITGMTNSVTSLFVSRLFLGGGEAASAPSCVKVIYAWFPRGERGLASGLFDGGQRAGLAFAWPIAAVGISLWGWRGPFFLTALIGVIWLIGWWALYREPEACSFITDAQREALLSARGSPKVSTQHVEWRRMLLHRNVLAQAFGHFCFDSVHYFFLTWFPIYLVHVRGFTLTELGTLGAVPPLMSIPGSALGGWASDFLARRNMNLTNARKLCLVFGMLCASTILFAALAENVVVSMALFSLSYAGLGFTGANMWALPADVAPANHYVATISGVVNCVGNMAVVMGSALAGLLLTTFGGSFLAPLTLAATFAILGAINYAVVLGRLEPLWAIENDPPTAV